MSRNLSRKSPNLETLEDEVTCRSNKAGSFGASVNEFAGLALFQTLKSTVQNDLKQRTYLLIQ